MGQERILGSGLADLNRQPIYLQLRDVFIDRIRLGEWKCSSLLPNEVQLATQFAVSVGTIRKVLDELSGLGLISRHQGRGTFVTDFLNHSGASVFDPLRDADGNRIDWDPPHVEVAIGQASRDETGLLRRERGKVDVVRLAWLSSRNKRVVAHQRSLVPIDIGIDVARCRHVSGLSELYSRAGVFVQKSEDTIRTVVPEGDVSSRLQIAETMPVQKLIRVYYDDKSQVVGASTLWMNLSRETYTCVQKVRDIQNL